MSARRIGAVAGAGLLALTLAAPALASTPASSSVAAGQSKSYTGTVLPGPNPTSACLNQGTGDMHAITYSGPATDATVTVTITWTPVVDAQASDLILTVFNAAGAALGSSDGSSTTESVTFGATKGQVYTAEACGFVNAQPQPYSGKIVAEVPATGVGPPAPVFRSAGTVGPPGPAVPEVPLAVLAPLAAAAIGGVGYGIRRSRTA